MRRERSAKASSSPRPSERDAVLLRWEMNARLAWLWATAIRLPTPPQPGGGVPGVPPAVSVVGFGDSIAAGVGVESQSEGLVARFAGEIAAGRSARWESFAVSGATADRLEELTERARGVPADHVLLSCGVNDVLRGRDPGRYHAAIAQFHARIRRRWPHARVVHAGLPSFAAFPALRGRLGRFLDRRALVYVAAAKRAAADAGALYAPFPPDVEDRHFARDGFHAGPDGCLVWARAIALRASAAAMPSCRSSRGSLAADPRPR